MLDFKRALGLNEKRFKVILKYSIILLIPIHVGSRAIYNEIIPRHDSILNYMPTCDDPYFT